jgi:1-phosphofructokinase family hexose kinase
MDDRSRGTALRPPPAGLADAVIVTVTPNPSVDRTLRIPPLVRGGLVRAIAATAEAGGKGINVARVLAMQGHPTLAVVPLSNASAGVFISLLGTSTPVEAVAIRGEIRVNVSLVEADGTVTKVNEPGPTLDPAEVDALLERSAAVAVGSSWVVGSGSLPPGTPADFYPRLADALPSGVRMAVDADGDALRACLGRRLALIKPNHHELETLVGRPLPTLGDVIAAGHEVVQRGVDAVLVSLGPDGAVLVDRSGEFHAEARIDEVVNTVGAGDALLAGFLASGGRRDGLATAVAWSVAACRSPGTQVRHVRPADFDAVIVHDAAAAARQLAA